MSVEIEKEKSEVIDKSPVLLKDLGMRFPTEDSKRKYRYGLYRCGYCDKEFEASTYDIKRINVRSCGCQKGGVIHKLSSHILYGIWNSMVYRCYNQNCNHYIYYGGRGITVCDEWRETPTQFIEDMFPSFMEGLTLDRIDNAKGYSKDNCRWATKTEQVVNRRVQRNNTSGFTGVSYRSDILKYRAEVSIEGKPIHLGYYQTTIEAAIARNNYIIENGLPNKLNIIPEEEI